MLKQLSLLSRFIREIAFDTKEEGEFKSRKFNARKFIIFGVTSLSLTLNLLTADRLYDAALKLFAAKKELKELKTAMKENNCLLPSDDAKVVTPSLNPLPPVRRK